MLRSAGVTADSYTLTIQAADSLGIDIDDRLFVRRVAQGLSMTVHVGDAVLCVNDRVMLAASVNRQRFAKFFHAARQQGAVVLKLQRGNPYSAVQLTAAQRAIVRTAVQVVLPPKTPISIQVVNMERRADRWSAVFTACEKLEGVDCKRFPAVDGLAHELTTQEKFRFRNAQEFNMLTDRGVVGCALSHIKFWQQAAQPQAAPWSIVLEDDLIPRPEFVKGLGAVLEQLPSDFDLVFIAHQGPGLLCPSRERFMARLSAMGLSTPPDQDIDLESSMNLCPSLVGAQKKLLPGSISTVGVVETRRPLWLGQGTGGYLVSKRGAAKLLELYEEQGMPDPVDKFMINRFMHLRTFVTTISLCHAASRHTDSDTGTTGKATPSEVEAQDNQIQLLELKVVIEGEQPNWYLDQWIPLIELYQARSMWEKSITALRAAWNLELRAGGTNSEAKGWYQQKGAVAAAELKKQQTAGAKAEL
jgi:GR25 family glycosyltransferase involved in LPS biosynthesis